MSRVVTWGVRWNSLPDITWLLKGFKPLFSTLFPGLDTLTHPSTMLPAHSFLCPHMKTEAPKLKPTIYYILFFLHSFSFSVYEKKKKIGHLKPNAIF